MKILGLDQSLASTGQTGLCRRWTGDMTTCRSARSISPPTDITGDDRFRWFRLELLNELATYKPDVVCFEDAPAMIQSASKNQLLELLGVVKGLMAEWKHSHEGFQYYCVNVTHVKQFATGKGSGDKGPVFRAAELAFPGVASNSDESDALWLAEIGAVVAKDAIAQNDDQIYVAAAVRGDRDAPALKKALNSDKGKQKRKEAKNQPSSNFVIWLQGIRKFVDDFNAPLGELKIIWLSGKTCREAADFIIQRYAGSGMKIKCTVRSIADEHLRAGTLDEDRKRVEEMDL